MGLSIGIDFDNTIICYDQVFHQAAKEKNLIPDSISPDKRSIRDYLRETGNEDSWTELQGLVYSIYINHASPFDGVLDFIRFCNENTITVFIVSHKTLYPYIGPEYNLHEAALNWIVSRRLTGTEDALLPRENVFFELTKELKLERISRLGCTYFIDDLPEFLSEPDFPDSVRRLLFDPNLTHRGVTPYQSMASWSEIQTFFRSVS